MGGLKNEDEEAMKGFWPYNRGARNAGYTVYEQD
jgi:hypothetical protein